MPLSDTSYLPEKKEMNIKDIKNLLLAILLASPVAVIPAVKADIVLDTVTSVIVPYYVNKHANSNYVTGLDKWSDPSSTWTSIKYGATILKSECDFPDCSKGEVPDVQLWGGASLRELLGVSEDEYLLPVTYSDTTDYKNVPLLPDSWIPDSLLGDNPDPVEHAQAAARLPDKDGNAYFMFTGSANYVGIIWVVEVKGINAIAPQHLTDYTEANIVWWSTLDDCGSFEECNQQNNEGNFNHPARISVAGNAVAVAFQNYVFGQYTHDGEAPRIVRTLGSDTEFPKLPKIMGYDSVGFYDVSNPKKPEFIRKLVGSDSETWGGKRQLDFEEISVVDYSTTYIDKDGDERPCYQYDSEDDATYPATYAVYDDYGYLVERIPYCETKYSIQTIPGEISEVALTKVGDYYHLAVHDKHYKMKSPFTSTSVVPIEGDFSVDQIALVDNFGTRYPQKITLSHTIDKTFVETVYVDPTHPGEYIALDLYDLKLGFSLESPNKISYDIIPNDEIWDSTSQFFTNDTDTPPDNAIYRTTTVTDRQEITKDWRYEACHRAWGFSALSNHGFNVICHDMKSNGYQFLVRGVNP